MFGALGVPAAPRRAFSSAPLRPNSAGERRKPFPAHAAVVAPRSDFPPPPVRRFGERRAPKATAPRPSSGDSSEGWMVRRRLEARAAFAHRLEVGARRSASALTVELQSLPSTRAARSAAGVFAARRGRRAAAPPPFSAASSAASRVKEVATAPREARSCSANAPRAPPRRGSLAPRRRRVRVRARYELVQRRARRGEGLARRRICARARERRGALGVHARADSPPRSRPALVGVPRVREVGRGAPPTPTPSRRRARTARRTARTISFVRREAPIRTRRASPDRRRRGRAFERARVFVGGSESLSDAPYFAFARASRATPRAVRSPPVRRRALGLARRRARARRMRAARGGGGGACQLAAIPGGACAWPRGTKPSGGCPRRRLPTANGDEGRRGGAKGASLRVFARLSLAAGARRARAFPGRQGAFSPRRRSLARVESAPNLVELAKDESSRDDRGGMISTGIGARAARAGRVRARDRG